MGASALTMLPAWSRPFRSGVTDATMATFPSSAAEASTTTPDLMAVFSESENSRSAFLSRPGTDRNTALTPAEIDLAGLAAARAAAPPPIASFTFSSWTSRVRRLVSCCSRAAASAACSSLTPRAVTSRCSVSRRIW